MGAVVKDGPWSEKILTIFNKKYIFQICKKYTSLDI